MIVHSSFNDWPMELSELPNGKWRWEIFNGESPLAVGSGGAPSKNVARARAVEQIKEQQAAHGPKLVLIYDNAETSDWHADDVGIPKEEFQEHPTKDMHPRLALDWTQWIINTLDKGPRLAFFTHDEAIILRVLRRIRETHEGGLAGPPIKPEDVAVYVHCKAEDGTSYNKRLRISRDGDFVDRWPGGFFTWREAELF